MEPTRRTRVYKTGRAARGRRPRAGALLLLAVAVLAVLGIAFFLFSGGQRVVLLGTDARVDGVARSDTVVVARAGGGALAVPRDTLVEVPGVGPDKLNAAFAYGGPELTVETLEGFLGLTIGDYVVVDFGGVEEIVDALGGVTVYVEEPVAYQLAGRYVAIPAGEQTLNGAEALAYVRYRGGPTADIGRIANQQRFLAALGQELTKPSNLPRLPATAEAIWNNVETSMNPAEAAVFALRMRLSPGQAPVEIYPGTPQYVGGVSYWVPDEEAGRRAVEATVE